MEIVDKILKLCIDKKRIFYSIDEFKPLNVSYEEFKNLSSLYSTNLELEKDKQIQISIKVSF